MAKKFRPRNDYVLVKLIDLGKTESGIAIPSQAQQGKERVVVAMGPKVKDLSKGDKVNIIGESGVDYAFLPDCRDMIIVKEANVILVIEETTEDVK